MTTLTLLLPLMGGCFKNASSGPPSVGKWEGTIMTDSPCDHGGYQGDQPLLVCMVLEQDGGGYRADIDWDGDSLRERCDYFEFEGRTQRDGSLELGRTDDPSEVDDVFRLRFQDGWVVGTFQVHPDCPMWDVSMRPAK